MLKDLSKLKESTKLNKKLCSIQYKIKLIPRHSKYFQKAYNKSKFKDVTIH